MQYRLNVADETADVAVSKTGDEHSALFALEGKQYHVKYRAISGNYLHLIANGRAIDAFVIRVDQGKYIFLNGRCYLVQDVDRLPLGRAGRKGLEEIPKDITPPMPAIVVRILVKEGDLVKRNQGLVVVSAMKMETTLKAPFGGRVKRINTSVDAKVSPGDVLVEIEQGVPVNE
jgi:biotin carboxyl carrier protein